MQYDSMQLSGPLLPGMINTIAEAGPSVKRPTVYQIGNLYLNKKMKEIEVYIVSIKAKWLQYGSCVMAGVLEIESLLLIS